jgi:hypothetical protein
MLQGWMTYGSTHLVNEREGLLSARTEELPLLRYYANSIAHLLDETIRLQ